MVLREKLHEAGTRFDGHVTNGSLEAQIQVVLELLREADQVVLTALAMGVEPFKGQVHEDMKRINSWREKVRSI